MGSWFGDESTVDHHMTIAPNDRRDIGLSPSILPENAIRDLRHPNPVRPVFSSPTGAVRAPTRTDCVRRANRRSIGAPGGPSSFPAAPQGRVTVVDQRIVVVEDRTDG